MDQCTCFFFYQNFSRNATWSAKDVMQFYRNIKSSKISCRPLIDKIFFHNFVELGFAIAEYNNCSKFKKKGRGKKKTVGVGSSYSVLENQSKFRKIMSIVLDFLLKKLWHV